MTVLVFGRTGQVSCALQRLAPYARYLERSEADFSDPAACAAWVAQIKPTAVINAVAYTAVDDAEDNLPQATTINGATPGVIAQACALEQIPLVHISTDYVFDGAGHTPFVPTSPTNPLGAYGHSKLAGENAVRAAGGTHGILRTSWVISATGKNFVKTMLHLGATHDALSVVADQVGGPTCADDIATACLEIAQQLARDPAKTGTYHFSGAPDVSWADFARAIFTRAGMDVTVTDIPATNFPTKAARPANSRMDNSTTQAVFDIKRPDWRVGLDKICTDLDIKKP